MSVIRSTLSLLLAAMLWLPAVGHAAPDTATELRLRSIEARLPDADELANLKRKVEQMEAGKGGGLSDNGSGESAAGSGGGNFQMLQNVQSLQDQVRQLRGDVEQLKHEAKKREKGQRELYQNLDARLQSLEKTGGGGSASNVTSADDNSQASDSAGAGAPVSKAPVDEAAAEKDYLAAFDLLKQGKYSESVTSFDAFVKKYPGSKYADNAWYWLGEAHYVNREYDQSVKAFRTVLKDFPDSTKAPGSLYKIGVIQDEQHETDAAQSTLAKVIRTYPDDNAAELARKRLKSMAGNGAGT